MRSSWSAELILAILAAASLEGAGLTIAYLALDWASGNRGAVFGMPVFGLAVLIGLAIARRLRRAPWGQYLVTVPSMAVLVAAVGGWATLGAAGAPNDPVSVLASAGTWLLGVAVLRGTAHAELDDEGLTAEQVLRVGLAGIILFWLAAAVSGLGHDVVYVGAAFGATLAFVSSGLLSLGLARLKELEVEAVDQAARRRWLALLFGVGGSFLLLGIPLAGLLGVPVATAVAGAAGPIGVAIIVAFTLLATPILFVAQYLIHFFGPLDVRLPIEIPLTGGRGSIQQGDVPTILVVIFGVFITIEVVALLAVVAAVLRRMRKRRPLPYEEVREDEPISLGLVLHLPRLGRRPRPAEPGDAVAAYRSALEALAGREEGRLPGETPREHAARIRAVPVGPSVARLAADYQLAALAGRHLTPKEEARAQGRWQRVRRWVR